MNKVGISVYDIIEETFVAIYDSPVAPHVGETIYVGCIPYRVVSVHHLLHQEKVGDKMVDLVGIELEVMAI